MTDTTQAGGAAPAAETSAPSGGDSLPSAADIMSFDPFGPSAELPEAAVVPDEKPAPTPADDKGTQGAPAVTTPPLKAGEQPPAGTPPVIDPNAPKPSPATTPQATVPQEDLAAMIRAQTALVQQALSPQKPAVPDPASAQPTPPRYQLGLPPQILNSLRSEDPAEFAGGMHAVINGIANRLWEDMQTHMTEYVTRTVPTIVSSHHESRTTQEQVAQDFYGAHPSLANPVLKPMIQNVGLMIVQRRQASGQPVAWDQAMRDEIAEEVYKAVPQLRPAQQQQQQPAPTPAPTNGAKPPPFSTGGGARPLPQTATNEFTELLIN